MRPVMGIHDHRRSRTLIRVFCVPIVLGLIALNVVTNACPAVGEGGRGPYRHGLAAKGRPGR